VLTARGLQVDRRVVDPTQWGAALIYFTGSQAHNIRIRERAVRRGWSLSEYGLTADGELVASATEDEVYAALDLAWIPPAMREDAGEVAAAEAGELPRPPTVDELRGDCHVHTDRSGDGRASLAEMVDACRARGLEYVTITDHGEDLRLNGVDRASMLAQREEIAALVADRGDITVLHGCELNIAVDGALDYDDGFLAAFDWTVASVHSHFDLDEAQQTERVLTAVAHPAVNAIGHLTGRRIGKRPGIELDLEAVLAACAETGTAIEINSHLDRLDAPAEVLRAAVDHGGVVFTVSSDAHHVAELANVRHGVRQAERGWVDAAAVVNTWSRERFLDWAGVA
jgi:DNA polymerase (family X)